MNKPRMALFARLSYSTPITDMRLHAYQHYFLGSLKAQLFKDFDVFVIVDCDAPAFDMRPAHPGNLKRIKTCNRDGISLTYTHLNDCPRTGYHISFRVDTDDWLSPQFTLKAVDAYRRFDADRFLLTFRHFAYDAKLGAFYSRPFPIWCRSWGVLPSAFTATCSKRKNTDPGFWPYALGRHWMAAKTHNLPVCEVNDELAISVIHGDNLGSKTQGKMIGLGEL